MNSTRLLLKPATLISRRILTPGGAAGGHLHPFSLTGAAEVVGTVSLRPSISNPPHHHHHSWNHQDQPPPRRPISKKSPSSLVGVASSHDDDQYAITPVKAEKDGEVAAAAGVEINQRRMGFIRKVYGIVTTQLVATSSVSAFMMVNPSIGHFICSSPSIPWLLFGAGLGSLGLLHVFENKHPQNLITLGAFTLTTSLMIFFPAFIDPRTLAFNAWGALLFAGYIVADTDSLIKRFKYDEYILASVSLFLDILNLFLKILQILQKIAKAKR
ncbi:hypothetical protein Tsubulata_014592 [Turnera subulata]|uniref:Uncharacterized protein n=1 Tax=Turnera subulata TaxID=218843 RepID=A0A9Q0G8U1_9ROSI|nr:hypothetical protein Tsubulata_014592 [Turnera subulata]